MYTVKQLADLAGVTVRTLHHYDEIGLLKPSTVGSNGYRKYTDEALFRLQQILLFREMDVDLPRIRQLIEQPGFDQISALQAHRQALQQKIERLKALIVTVDTTIMHLIGEVNMSSNNIFEGFDEETQKRYEAEATRLWGDTVTQSVKLWNSYSEQEKAQIMEEGRAIYADFNTSLEPGSPQIQAILKRWHQHLRYFYEPTLEILRGLGEMYHDHPDFNATFTKLHPDLPAFLKQAIAIYVDDLETKWLEEEVGKRGA